MSIHYENLGLVARITIDRPAPHNAFNDAMVAALREAWRRFEQSDQRVAVVTGGSSKHFTVGADLKDMPTDVWQGVPGVGATVSKPVPAQRALSMGLVNAVVPADDLVETAMQYAQDIADSAPLVVRWLKESVDRHVLPDSPTVHALRTMDRVREMIDSRDFAEGKDAFVSRRLPNFIGS